MEIDTTQTVAFTGHRHYKEECTTALQETIRTLYAQGFRTFLSGMAIGFDLAAAEAVISLREELTELRLGCIVPFKGMEHRFSAESRERFERIIRSADHVEILAEHYSHDIYFRRNDALIKHSTLVVAYFTGEGGGTAYTVRKALKKRRRLINLYADPQQIINFVESI
jgi:uncharacterized phage-like protein YoqJ